MSKNSIAKFYKDLWGQRNDLKAGMLWRGAAFFPHRGQNNRIFVNMEKKKHLVWYKSHDFLQQWFFKPVLSMQAALLWGFSSAVSTLPQTQQGGCHLNSWFQLLGAWRVRMRRPLYMPSGRCMLCVCWAPAGLTDQDTSSWSLYRAGLSQHYA